MSQVIKHIVNFIKSPIVSFVIAVLILGIYMFQSGTSFLKLNRIYTDYYKIFSGAKKHLWIFWGLPALFAFSLVQITLVDSSVSENLLVFLSILIAAFFSILAILVTQQGFSSTSKKYQQVLRESATVVLVEIILCVLSLILTLSSSIIDANELTSVSYILSFLDYYCIFVLLFNLLILIKRLKALIDNTDNAK